jgi:hypothetical protein
MRKLVAIQSAAFGVLGLVLACSSPDLRREQAIERAAKSIGTGDMVTAETEIAAYLSFAPNDIEARVRLAQVMASQGLQVEALSLVTDLPPGLSLDVHGRSLLGRLLVDDRQLRRCAPILVALEHDGVLEPDLKRSFLEAVARRDPADLLSSLPGSWLRDLVPHCLRFGNLDHAIECLARVPVDDPLREAVVDSVLANALERGQLDAV